MLVFLKDMIPHAEPPCLKVLHCPSLVSLQMNLQVQADFHTKHFFIACQEEFTQSCKKRINFILMASPHLSLCLPASFPSLLFSPPVPLSSLSAE